jgi:lipopolysaccharide/colanic/teichoic acid biosynthesis glycosyltransferase
MSRCFDIILASSALVFFSPVLLLVMVVLRLTGEGEIFFKQKRIGLGGEPFELIKFATMKKDSPSMAGGTITLKDDPRILPFGKFLRSTKLNELPQLSNIIKGDMSLIGPRPQTQRCFDAFPSHTQKVISLVKPGLSGIGSIVFRGEDKMLEEADAENFYDHVIMPYKGRLEEWYVSKRSSRLYFTLIALTILVVISRRLSFVWFAFRTLPRPPKELHRYLDFK